MASEIESLFYTYYALELQDKPYYVERTKKKLDQRYDEHDKGKGCQWTKFHPPIKILEHFKEDAFYEDALVLKYMARYGIDKVRGGTFSQVQLSKSQRETLENRLKSASDARYTCGESGHFAKSCPQTKKKTRWWR
jgi:predicted GIY-YIG superfamily endonuclease